MYKRKLTADWPWSLTDTISKWGAEAKELVENYLVSPSVNITESEDAYNIYMLAPGWEKKDFSINVEKGILSISAEGKSTDENTKWLRREWGLGEFTRKFTLKENTDPKKVTAKYENGVLEITIQKIEIKSPKSEIKIS